ncbi:hypothetical protein GEV33_013260 [Tenebrio molitor]|uniref:Uncharacterized protein n=1 Tax=Tenebrio molitor TaxID=7067 RepID=A0A8J6H7J9_TENMO|nr:hypothetical protein GEV33_013260 [Tenebrio molitor]
MVTIKVPLADRKPPSLQHAGGKLPREISEKLKLKEESFAYNGSGEGSHLQKENCENFRGHDQGACIQHNLHGNISLASDHDAPLDKDIALIPIIQALVKLVRVFCSRTPEFIDVVFRMVRQDRDTVAASRAIRKLRRLRWASAVSALARKGVGELQPIKLAGHSSLQSVKPYLQLYSDHDQKLTKSLRELEVDACPEISIIVDVASLVKSSGATSIVGVFRSGSVLEKHD